MRTVLILGGPRDGKTFKVPDNVPEYGWDHIRIETEYGDRVYHAKLEPLADGWVIRWPVELLADDAGIRREGRTA